MRDDDKCFFLWRILFQGLCFIAAIPSFHIKGTNLDPTLFAGWAGNWIAALPTTGPAPLYSTHSSRPVRVMLDVREGSTVFRRRSICFLLQYFPADPKKRVNSPSMISHTQASHLCIIFFSSITIILTDSRADDKSISSLTTMIQGSCSVFERQRYLIVGITLYL